MATDKEKIADEIMDSLIDERNLTANDLLNGDQAALLHTAIVTHLTAAEQVRASEPRGNGELRKKLYHKISGTFPQWLPEVNECFMVTLTRDEKNEILVALYQTPITVD